MTEVQFLKGQFVYFNPFYDCLVYFCHVLCVDQALLDVILIDFFVSQLHENNFHSPPYVSVIKITRENGQ